MWNTRQGLRFVNVLNVRSQCSPHESSAALPIERPAHLSGVGSCAAPNNGRLRRLAAALAERSQRPAGC